MKKLVLLACLLASIYSFSQDTITSEKAKNYLDKMVVVKGKVVSYRMASDGGKINFLNIDKAFPDNVFNVQINSNYLPRLKVKIESLKGKEIYIKGKISISKTDAKQIPMIFNPISISEVKK